ncbi:hypothetical protein BIW11_05299, partial [Tropilaelaps mercedesae]
YNYQQDHEGYNQQQGQNGFQQGHVNRSTQQGHYGNAQTAERHGVYEKTGTNVPAASGPRMSKSIDDDENSRSWFNSTASDKHSAVNQSSSTLYDGFSTAGGRSFDYDSFDQSSGGMTMGNATGQQQATTHQGQPQQQQQQAGGAKLPQDAHGAPGVQQQGHSPFATTGQQQQQQHQQVQGGIGAQKSSANASNQQQGGQSTTAGGGLERKPSLQRQHATQVRRAPA